MCTPSGKQTTPQLHVSDIDDADDFGVAMSGPATDRTRAFLKVQDGCDYHCTFCTIPLARGASRSQDVERMHGAGADARGAGVQRDRAHRRERRRLRPEDRVESARAPAGTRARCKDLRRIRISSIEPNLLTDEILAFVADHEQVCRHFHIPLQSGSDSVLRRMRRRYTAGMYGDLVRRVRERFPDAGIGVDVITGFPGETEAEFDETHQLLADLPVSYLHVFTYSERPNTPAAESGERVPPSVRAQRNEQLRILGQRKRKLFAEQHAGRTVEVLAESTVEDGMRFGFTDSFLRVGFDAEAAQENELLACARYKCTGRPLHRRYRPARERQS